MITYSPQDMQRQLIADQRLWRRLPAAVAAVFWPLEVILLGWSLGWWVGAATVVVLAALSVLVPPRLPINIYFIDLLDRLLGLPLWLGWLLLVWHLSAREPLFVILGQPVVGAIAVAVSGWIVTRILVLASRLLAQRAVVRGG